jgi:UDP-N-acetylmuramoyl-L-alanyl-D-glutamate--2,6-diaminopimelate ligase
MGSLRSLIQSLLPRRAYRALLVPYHAAWAFIGAVWHGFPAKKLVVIGVTGTKGKSSVTEMVSTILEQAGHTVAVSSTIHFKTGKSTRPNLFKMTLPGRAFIQKLLAEAVADGATHAVIELTSESALQYRHLFLYLDALIFTNLEKEHLESHGGMENYFQAKFRLGKALARSPKRPRAIIANNESEYGRRFLALPVERSIPFSITEATELTYADHGSSFLFDDVRVELPQPGAFSVRNALASMHAAAFLGISVAGSAKALATLTRIKGRAEHIDEGQPFAAVVDYAHTPDSLQALYDAYPGRKICVLGNTGGGRDTWKRPEMGRIADDACDEVILTDEDPYDEDPAAILEAMKAGMRREPQVIMDRREAIRTALGLAQPGDTVLITGKGTDPYIMQAQGKKLPWSDASVVSEELKKMR